MMAAVICRARCRRMGSIALVALIMALCDVRFSAFQYALLSALALPATLQPGYPAGRIADHGGWFVYFVVSFVHRAARACDGVVRTAAHIVALDRQHEATA